MAAVKAATTQFAAWVRESKKEEKNFLILPCETDLTVWYTLIFINDPAHALFGAEIIFELKITDEFPAKPPSISCLTETGQFIVGDKICVGIGEYHSEKYNPSLGLPGFVEYMFYFVMNIDDIAGSSASGLGIIPHPSKGVRERCAKVSRSYNQKKLTDIYNRFESFALKYKDLKPVQVLLAVRNGSK
jgi:ubiquitin-protein ligase